MHEGDPGFDFFLETLGLLERSLSTYLVASLDFCERNSPSFFFFLRGTEGGEDGRSGAEVASVRTSFLLNCASRMQALSLPDENFRKGGVPFIGFSFLLLDDLKSAKVEDGSSSATKFCSLPGLTVAGFFNTEG
jgi:hypothetical protein